MTVLIPIPSTRVKLNSGRIVQQTLTFSLPAGVTVKEGEQLTISNPRNIEIYLPRTDAPVESYTTPILQDENDPRSFYVTFYYSVNLNVIPNSDTAEYSTFSKYTPLQRIVYGIGAEVNVDATNPTAYLFQVSSNEDPNPYTDPEHTAIYTVTVTDELGIGVKDYDVYWTDYVLAGILKNTNVFTLDSTNSPVKIQPIDIPVINSPVGSSIYTTRTNGNGSTSLLVTGTNKPIYGGLEYYATILDHDRLGTITIYDPRNPAPLIPSPLILGISYKDGNVNLDAMPDPLQTTLLHYNNSANSDTILLISNDILTDSASFAELNGATKTLNLAKTTLYSKNGPDPVDLQNQLLYVVASNDGTVRTSMINKFYAVGSNHDHNQPDPSIQRYSPSAVLPDIDGIYITKDDTIGGLRIRYPFTNPTRKPLAGYYLTATYYLNGYHAGTEVPRSNKIVRPSHLIKQTDLDAGFYEDLLEAFYLQGYSKSSTGKFLKLYVEYSISTQQVGGVIDDFAINDHYFMSTVAPGDF